MSNLIPFHRLLADIEENPIEGAKAAQKRYDGVRISNYESSVSAGALYRALKGKKALISEPKMTRKRISQLERRRARFAAMFDDDLAAVIESDTTIMTTRMSEHKRPIAQQYRAVVQQLAGL